MNTPPMSATPSTAPVRQPQLIASWPELLARYGAVFKAAWAHRKELAGPTRLADEAAFLPAALSLQHTPVHPAPRRLAWAVMALLAIALIWSIVGKIDIVAVASGRIVVSERTKLVQPLQTSVVRRVLVKDGDHVITGQPLVELDPTDAKADNANIQEQRAAALSEELRTAALLQAIAKNVLPPLPLAGEGRGEGSRLNPATRAQQAAQTKAQLQAEYQDIRAKLSKLDAELTRRQAESATVQETIAKLEATVPMAQTREADFKRLVEQGYMSSHATQDKTRERVELERDLATQRARLAESRSAQKESEQARAAYLAETERLLHDRHAQASTKRQQLDAEQAKAAQREKLTTLTSPADGTVQQLAIHSVGGVATEAQALMVIVPDGAEVTAEVVLDNKDIGFVRPGDEAVIKLETFPFTRYGTLPAKVERVTADAVNDEKRGAVFSVSLALLQKQIDVDGHSIKLSPGMNLTAEIKTGKRRVIEYLLSPIQRATSESLRER